MRIRIVDEQPPSGDSDELGRRITRRDALVKGAGAVGVLGLAACGGKSASTSSTAASTPSAAVPTTLRVLGIGVDQNPVLKAQALKDLNITLDYTITDAVTQTQKAITQPQNFDLNHAYVHQVPQILPAGTTQPIDTSKISHWSGNGSGMDGTGTSGPTGVVPLLTVGKLEPNNPAYQTGQGDAAYRMLPLNTSNPSQLTGGAPFDAALKETVSTSTTITGMPGVYNVDSMGYDKKVIPLVTSWAQLFNPAYKGRVALINDPAIGLMDAALAAEASGKLTFANKGNMTKGEIDNLAKLLIGLKKAGQFRAFWSTFTESVNLMAAGEVVIESMWSPAHTILLELGKNVGFAAPKEGFRGWCGCSMIFKHVSGPTLDAAYRYLNWWLAGFAGANMARQAYYSPRPDTARKHMSAAEWDYWYLGKPAATNLVGPDGKAAIPKGSVREGGSYLNRVRNYAVWNSIQPQNTFITTRWSDFIAA
jgi:putative spermidine/putrescine transport system substrate-binding protein